MGGLELKFAIKARARPGLGPGSNFLEGPRPGPGPGSTFKARARPGLDILGLDPSLIPMTFFPTIFIPKDVYSQ